MSGRGDRRHPSRDEDTGRTRRDRSEDNDDRHRKRDDSRHRERSDRQDDSRQDRDRDRDRERDRMDRRREDESRHERFHDRRYEDGNRHAADRERERDSGRNYEDRGRRDGGDRRDVRDAMKEERGSRDDRQVRSCNEAEPREMKSEPKRPSESSRSAPGRSGRDEGSRPTTSRNAQQIISVEDADESGSSSSSSSEAPDAKNPKIESDDGTVKLDRAARKELKKMTKKMKKVTKVIEKLRRKNENFECSQFACLTFIVEVISRIVEEPDTLSLRRIPESSRMFHYILNVKEGLKLLKTVGFEPGQESWLLKDPGLPLARQALPLLKEALASVQSTIDEFPLKPIGRRKRLFPTQDRELSSFENRIVGAYLGQLCGDVLGAPFEGWRPDVLEKWFRRVIQFQDLPHSNDAPGGLGVYTADTEMLLATTESIVDREILDIKSLSARLAEVYADESIVRAYPDTLQVIMPLLVNGDDYRKTGTFLSPDGSTHNEGLCRMLPIALCFRNAPDDVLIDAIKGVLLCTTIHPDVIGACFVFVKALIELLQCEDLKGFDALAWTRGLLNKCENNAMRSRLQVIVKAAQAAGGADAKGCYVVTGDSVSTVSDELQMEAVEAISVALVVFMEYWQRPAEAIVRAVHMGGDTNTIAAIVGALVGALHGYTWVPAVWFDHLENDEDDGRDYIIKWATLLSKYDFTKPGHVKNNAKPIVYKQGTYKYDGTKKAKRQFGAKETIYSWG